MRRTAEFVIEAAIRAGCLLGIAVLMARGWVLERRERASWGEP